METTELHRGEVRVAMRWNDAEHHFVPYRTPALDHLIPRELLLYSLGLCAAKTAKAFMDKMRVELTEFCVAVTGTLEDPEPKAYTAYVAMNIEFDITAGTEFLARIENAISLTHEKYCGLTLMLQKVAPITNTIVFNGRIITKSL